MWHRRNVSPDRECTCEQSMSQLPMEGKHPELSVRIKTRSEIVRSIQGDRRGKTEVGLDHDHLSSVKAFGVGDRGQLLQHAWTTGLERDNRLIEPLIMFACARSTKLCELKDLGENGAIDYLKNSISIWNKSNSSDTMSLKTFEDARKVAYKACVYARCTHTQGSVSYKNETAYELCTLRIETNIFRLESMGMIVSDILTSKTLEIQRNRSLIYSDIPNILLWTRDRSRKFKLRAHNGARETNKDLSEETSIGNRANIEGAKKEPKSLLSELADDINRGSNVYKIIQWHFASPLTLHFTVVHESMIKSTKNASTVLYSRADISKEERITTIISAKGLVNPRQS